MAAVGPFERRPHLAVAVSGGADSLALCLLTDAWARERDGRVTALTVDHGLRPGSAQESALVKTWLSERGIDHVGLTWTEDKPGSGIQAAARRARYRLMADWCREAGVLHLLLGHHRRDQAETVLMRMARGSGPDGLAAMAPVVETVSVRLLRPLLDMAPERLRAFIKAIGQPWIEDPSNTDSRFARTRVRATLPGLAATGVTTEALADQAQRMGEARSRLDEAEAVLMARGCRLHPAGFAWLDVSTITAAPKDVQARVLGRLLGLVGGRQYRPSGDKLARVVREVVDGGAAAATLGGCALHRYGGALLVYRESRGLPSPQPVSASASLFWDGRFAIRLATEGGDLNEPVWLAPIGAAGWREMVQDRPELRRHPLPSRARPTLPSLKDSNGVFNAPHLCYRREQDQTPKITIKRVIFRRVCLF